MKLEEILFSLDFMALNEASMNYLKGILVGERINVGSASLGNVYDCYQHIPWLCVLRLQSFECILS